MARATLVSRFVSVLHYYPCADILQPAALLRLDVAADSATHISIPFDIPAAIFLALNTCRDILASAQHRVPRILIGMFRGAYASFLSMLMCSCRPGLLVVSASSL